MSVLPLLMLIVLVAVGLLCLAGLAALVVWLVRRPQTGVGPVDAGRTEAPPY